MNKFEFTIPEKYKEAVEYDKRHKNFTCGEEGAMFARLLLELETLRCLEEEKWLRENQNELEFEFYFELFDCLFAGMLSVTDVEGEVVYENQFLLSGDAEKFLEEIGISQERWGDGLYPKYLEHGSLFGK